MSEQESSLGGDGQGTMPLVTSAREPKWVSWAEAAELAGCPVTTIEWWTRQGAIERRPHHGRWPTLRRSSVEAFIEWQRQRARERADRGRPAPVRQGPPDETGWLSTRDAADLLARSDSTVRRLIRAGVLDGVQLGGALWVREDQVRELAEDRGQWISYATAAALVGCSDNTILRAVRTGRITRRDVHRALPALERATVEQFAEEWRAEQARRLEERAARAAARAAARRPPDDGNVWLDSSTTAIVLGLSRTRVDQLAHAGRLPHTVHGGQRWFRRDHVEQAAAGRALQAPPARARLRNPARSPDNPAPGS